MDNENNNLVSRKELINNYIKVRNFSNKLAEPLEIEDYVIQSMPDVSPTKWHLAHTSWFFETFILSKLNQGYESPFPQYNYLFNSYYVQVGERHSRPKRGLISRPTVEEVYEYRTYIDEQTTEFLETCDETTLANILYVIDTGIHHEQQHQELIVTDIKHVFSVNPLKPRYIESKKKNTNQYVPDIKWKLFEGGIYSIGHNGNGFAYDNEIPIHKEYIEPFEFASRLITNGEYIEFIEDGGYQKPVLWLSDGRSKVEDNNWTAPFYWEKQDDKWHYFTLTGMREVDLAEPVCHVSHYEADAFARWYGARLPSESEWEIVSNELKIEGNFVDNNNFHPSTIVDEQTDNNNPKQMFGDVWEWTSSPYSPYPGFKIAEGALGEYNGKFMCNQMVLRGGSCATSKSHIRRTYRNFFPSDARWQFMGIRLAKDAK